MKKYEHLIKDVKKGHVASKSDQGGLRRDSDATRLRGRLRNKGPPITGRSYSTA